MHAPLRAVAPELSPAAGVESLWREFARPLRAFLRSRVRNDADADDLLQNVFLRIQRGAQQLRDPARLQGWVFRIARNALADHHRRGPREQPTADLPELIESLDGEELVDLRPALRRMIRELPEDFRAAILLTEFEGLSQVELARRLGLSVSGAKSRVQRARAELRRMLDDCCRFEFDRRGRVIAAERRSPRRDETGCGC
ncbi:MAG: RNA polymerase sigma factor SigZ [Verrucomicrobia bacterium]|nr:RNA polymerase sigma factor SigZ [Verrucomicrobiota bacterium]